MTILIDANLLIYAFNPSAQQHRRAREWLEARLNGPMPVGLPWPSLVAFLRVSTHSRIFERPLTIPEAWDQVLRWLSSPVAWAPNATERHQGVLGQLLYLPGLRGNLVHDADLAALAIEHGLTLCSTDGDFARFPGLRWENPLAA